MAPEQAVGDRVDHRADLYALGVVLWECIAGRPLWDAPDLTGVVTRQMTEAVPKLATYADATVPEELDDLLQKLTSRMPADRPDSSGDVRDTLRKLAVAPETSGALERISQSVVWVRAKAVTAEHAFRSLPPPKQKRALVATGVVLLALVSLAFLLPKKSGKPAPTGSQAMGAVAQDEDEKVDEKPEPEVPEELAGNLGGSRVVVAARAGDEGKLYGSIGAHDIADAVEKFTGIAIDQRIVKIDKPIKDIGLHEVTLMPHEDVSFQVTLDVIPA